MGKSALTLRSEEKLLVLIANEAMRENPGDERARSEAAALLAAGFDWPLFMRLVARHNYAAVGHAFFHACGLLGEVPEEARAILGYEGVLSRARFLKKEFELLEIVRELEKAGIAAVAIKGIPLAHLLYSEPGVRVSKDIDILVPKAHIATAKDALLKIGYSLYEGIHTAEDFRAYHFHYVFCRGVEKDSVVELHWDLLSPRMEHYSFDAAELFERAIPVRVGDATVKAPCLVHAFWHMGIHASYRSFLAFRSLMEMNGMARRFDAAQWDDALSWSARCNTEREIAMALNLCEALCGEFLQAPQRRIVRPGRARRWFILSTFYPRALVWEWLPLGATHELVIALYMKRGAAARMKYLFRLVVPDRATRFGLYFKYRGDGVFDRIGLHLNGFYVMLKTVFLTISMGLLVQTGILGRRRLDPDKNVCVRAPEGPPR